MLYFMLKSPYNNQEKKKKKKETTNKPKNFTELHHPLKNATEYKILSFLL